MPAGGEQIRRPMAAVPITLAPARPEASSIPHTMPRRRGSIPPPPGSLRTRFQGWYGRLAIGPADHGKRAAQRDEVDVMARRGCIRPGLAPPGHAAVHELRVAPQAVVRTYAQAFGHARTEDPSMRASALSSRAQEQLPALRLLLRSIPTERRPRPEYDVGGCAAARHPTRPEPGSTRRTSAPMSDSIIPANGAGARVRPVR